MEKYLWSQHRLIQATLDGVADPIMVVGLDFYLKLMNQAGREYSGCGERPVADLPPCHQLIFGLDRPCDQVGRPCPLQEVVRTGQRVRIEHDRLTAAGEELSFEILATPLFGENGELLGIVESLRNITARKQIAKMLLTEQERLEKRVGERTAELVQAGQLAAIGELAAGVAHEINNPINGIINFAQLLADESRGGEQLDLLRRIIKEGERVANIVSNLLAFSRQGQDNKEPEEVSIPMVLENALALYTHQFYKDGIVLSVDIEDDLPMSKVNPQQTQQVFLNLLSNARHALNQSFSGKDPAKKLAIQLFLYQGEDGRFVRAKMTDYGIGIPKELFGKIFEPFFSSKKAGEGTGLGLSISQGIVQGFGGRLLVESEIGRYTTMIVDLPTYEE